MNEIQDQTKRENPGEEANNENQEQYMQPWNHDILKKQKQINKKHLWTVALVKVYKVALIWEMIFQFEKLVQLLL